MGARHGDFQKLARRAQPDSPEPTVVVDALLEGKSILR